MAKRLTEEMVIARSKLSDLSKVKRLNCWGSELVDVSLLRKMPSVEVLSLSINKINSLSDFQFCDALQELYIRQNDIRDLNQICYLQRLPHLKNLWLEENPCAAGDGYRMTVLRTLPQLQKLDNVPVSQEELREAARKGRILSHPEDPQDSEEEQYIPQGQYQRYPEYSVEDEYSPQRSPPRQEPEYEQEETDDYYEKDETTSINNHAEYSPPLQASTPRREPTRRNYSPEQEYAERRTSSYDQEYSRHSQQFYDKSPTNNNSNDEAGDGTYRDIKLVASQSANSIKDYTNGDKYNSPNTYRPSEGSDISTHTHEAGNRRERFNCPATHQPPFNRRPVTRNSNILSAVLCLVKELDYPSLEVVEMAVRCRMDELEE